MNASPLSSSYLPHLNGLRALAILGVLFYHLSASYCPTGYFGVDLFLVISGFLLFRSLLKPGAAEKFHYGSYLLKKAWRILPAWFVVTLAVCSLSVCLFHSDRMADILGTARDSSFFLADYHIDLSGDYFNIFSQQNPLLHYWYLSITEQLYIIAPLLVIPLARWCSRRVAAVALALLSLLSLAFYILTMTEALVPSELRDTLLGAVGSKSSYYHLIPRFWEVAAGAAVFLLPEFATRPRLRTLLGGLGLVGIIASFFVYGTGSPAIYLTVASSLLALRYAVSGPVAWLLGCKPVQFIGTISFSLYLWHWPVMVFWKYSCLDAPGAWDEVGMVAVSLVLGTLGWWAVERLKTPSLPGRKGTLLRCSLLLLLPAAFVGATQMSDHTGGSENQGRGKFIPVSRNETDPDILKGTERFKEVGLTQPLLRFGADLGKPSLFLMGDSHAVHLYNALDEACQQEGIQGLFLNSRVVPFWNYLLEPYRSDTSCWSEAIATTLFSYLEQHPEIRYVLISLCWERRSTVWAASVGKDWRTGKRFRSLNEAKAVTSAGLGELCDRLRAMGKEVILLGDTPGFPMNQPSPLDEWERCQKLNLPYTERVITQEQHDKDQAFAHALHQRLETEGRAHYIDLAPALKDGDRYPARVNGQFLYQDVNHLTLPGSRRAIRLLMPRLMRIMRDTQPTSGN